MLNWLPYRMLLPPALFAFLWLFHLWSAPSAMAQRLDFRHLTIEDGLSQNAVYALLQDRQGFMWFGTKDGLNRYDGYDYTVFRHDPFDPKTLSGNYITTLYEDEYGGLWIGTVAGGLNYFRRDSERFERIDLGSATGQPVAPGEITAMGSTEENTLWVGTRGNGLFRLRYDPDSLPACRIEQWVHTPRDQRSLPDNHVTTLFAGPQGSLWIGTQHGLSIYDRRAGH